jgi:hypothetical protein
VYLTVLALFLTVVCGLTGGIEIYGYPNILHENNKSNTFWYSDYPSHSRFLIRGWQVPFQIVSQTRREADSRKPKSSQQLEKKTPLKTLLMLKQISFERHPKTAKSKEMPFESVTIRDPRIASEYKT